MHRGILSGIVSGALFGALFGARVETGGRGERQQLEDLFRDFCGLAQTLSRLSPGLHSKWIGNSKFIQRPVKSTELTRRSYQAAFDQSRADIFESSLWTRGASPVRGPRPGSYIDPLAQTQRQ